MNINKVLSDFKEIMDKYPKAINEKQKGHPLASKMRNDFKNDLESFVNSITNSSYNFRISPGKMGNWVNPPWAGIKSSSMSNKFTEGLYVIYHFNIEDHIIDFSINQGLDTIKRSEAINRANELRKHVNLIDGFTLDDDPRFKNSQTAILYKTYEINKIDPEKFTNDLIDLLNVYEDLIPFYNELTHEEENEPDEVYKSLNMDNRKVWRVSPGNYNITDEMSKYFIENEYIAIGFNNVLPLDDLNDFKSKEDIDKYISINYGESEIKQNSNQIWTFINDMSIGDIIIMNHGRSAVYAIGIIKSDYIPASELEFECINGLNKCRKVEWIVTTEFNLNQYTLNRHTITEIKSDLWNEILLKYLNLYPEIKNQLLNDIYQEYYNTYRNTEEGKYHFSRYSEESKVFKESLRIINNDYNQGIDVTDNVLMNLVSPKGYLFEFYKNLKSFLTQQYQRTDGELKELSLILLKIINTFDNETDEKILKNILKEYNSNKLSKGIKAGILSTSFYLLNNDYYAINKKTIKSLQLMSLFIDEKIILENTLPKYLDNNRIYHNFLEKISFLNEHLGSFEEFDEFSHWLSTTNLGNYANGKMLPFYYSEKKLTTENPRILEFDINKIISEKGTFFDYLLKENLIFNPELVENYLLSLKVKPFVILTGNSGTGKTRIAKEYSEYLDCNSAIIPVGSNWTDNHNIIGYDNPFIKEYYQPEAFKLINSAGEDNQPSFLILDEMNLSHVEHYFSDILSSIESGVDIPLNINKVSDMNNKLKLSENLFIVGTVNVDETTYMFSPKVLDRANTIEFKTIKPGDYINHTQHINFEDNKNLDYLINPYMGKEVRTFSVDDIKKALSDVTIYYKDSERLLIEVLVDLLDELYVVLKKSHFDFGFRVINEILRFMYVAWFYENQPDVFNNWARYFDTQIKQKILPKIHGSEYTLKDTLNDIQNICEKNHFKSSVIKINEMKKVLKEQKFVSFIN